MVPTPAPREREQPVVVLRGIARRHLVGPGSGFSRLKTACAVSIAPLASARWSAPVSPEAVTPKKRTLPCSCSRRTAGHHRLQHPRDPEGPLLAHAPDQVVQVQQIHPLEPEPREARLDRAATAPATSARSAASSRHFVPRSPGGFSARSTWPRFFSDSPEP